MARCVVVGSVGVDEVVRLERSLRAGAHLQGRPTERRLGGGAANTGVALARAGHKVTLVAAVGKDTDGDWVLAELQGAGLDTSPVVRLPDPTTRSLVLVDPDGDRTIVNLHRCVEPKPPARLLELPAEVVYVRSRELNLAGLLAARVATTLVVAHVPPVEAGARPAHVLVGSVADLSAAERRSLWKLGRSVAGEVLRWFVLTRGPDGAEAVAPGLRLRAAAPRVDAVDTTGAGDVFAAGIVHALLAGMEMPAALELACAWGAVAVTSPGRSSGEGRPELTPPESGSR
jgi:sugar/nucleoside kinase (ribokinase family)